MMYNVVFIVYLRRKDYFLFGCLKVGDSAAVVVPITIGAHSEEVVKVNCC